MTTFSNEKTGASRICLGTGRLGSEIDRKTSFAVLDAYVAAGGNFLDTAHIYAAWVPNGWGASERLLGEWLRAHGARREIVIGTKGAHPPMENMAQGRCTRRDIERDLDESLERLGVETIDIYWLHRDDPAQPAEAIVDALAAIAASGRIRAYGGSNWTVERLEAANQHAHEKGCAGMIANQPGWALANRAPGPAPVDGMLFLDAASHAWHMRSGLPVAAYSAQALGYFGASNAAWAKNGFCGPAPRGKDYDWEESRGRLRRAITLGEAYGATPNQIALAYLLAQPFPVYPIIGTGNPDRVREAMDALSITLRANECAFLTG